MIFARLQLRFARVACKPRSSTHGRGRVAFSSHVDPKKLVTLTPVSARLRARPPRWRRRFWGIAIGRSRERGGRAEDFVPGGGAAAGVGDQDEQAVLALALPLLRYGALRRGTTR